MKSTNLSIIAILLVACGEGSNTSDSEVNAAETGIAACHLPDGTTAVISYKGQGLCWESDGTLTPPVQFTSVYFDTIVSDQPCDRADPDYTGCCVYPKVVEFSYDSSSCGKGSTGKWYKLP